MSESCNHDCSSCGKSCDSRETQSLLVEPNPNSHIKKVIAVVSGKGGVGKSLISSLLATAFNQKNYNTALLDADVTGPSIPKLFGITDKAQADESGMYPVKSRSGIELMSLNLLLENDTDPVIWRGPVIAGIIRQFWQDVNWGNVDYMFIDMPPGTGDVPLTVFQSIKIDGIIIATTPQELVSLIVAKAVNMAKMMNIPIIGMVENMSYMQCPDCGKMVNIWGKSTAAETAAEYGIPLLDRVPLDPQIATLCDGGEVEAVGYEYITNTVKAIEEL